MKASMLVFSFLVICLPSADALDVSDATTRLDNLVSKSLVLEQGILSVQKSSSPQVDRVRECLNELYYKLEVISVRIDGLYSNSGNSFIDERQVGRTSGG
jgi:hypothetical protein